jgi:hypothetical protein
MNPINRVGQKVRCVGDERVWLFMVCPVLKSYPKRGEIYTVAGFGDVAGTGRPGIHLREIADLECACKQTSGVPWLLSAFRPLDERKTDIGEFQALLKKTETVHAELSKDVRDYIARLVADFERKFRDDL